MQPLNFSVPESAPAMRARELLLRLRETFAVRLAAFAEAEGRAGQRGASPSKVVEWLRDEGRHGGGNRQLFGADAGFVSASLNFSQVHYDDIPEKALGSATALSCIVHPQPPAAPSLHLHLSWTQMKRGAGSWRLMADLNPSTEITEDTTSFVRRMDAVCGALSGEATQRGDDYFFIPSLNRTRGVAHYYFERFVPAESGEGPSFAGNFGAAAIDAYADILARRMGDGRSPAAAEFAAQRAYHTLYLYQVLTLDRGTTSGLLVHDQNDEGILASLPPSVDVAILESWIPRTPKPQDALVFNICEVLRTAPVGELDTDKKSLLAGVLRAHYAAHPEALAMQAGDPASPLAASRHTSDDTSGG